MQQPVEFKKVREFGEIIGDTFLFIKQNFKPLMKAYFYLCGFFILGGLLSTFANNLRLFGFLDSSTPRAGGSPMSILMMRFTFNYIVIFIFLVLGYASFFASILSYIALYIRKGNLAPTVQEVWSYFKFYFWRVFGGGFLITVFWGICTLLCLIPGIWVTPAVSIFFSIMVMENAGIGYAFNRCFKLVTNEWWITFATLVVVYVIYTGAVYFVQIPTFIMIFMKDFTHFQSGFTTVSAIVMALSQYIGQIFMIIPIVACTLIYFNLVERKESAGLLERIEAFGQKTVDNEMPEEY